MPRSRLPRLTRWRSSDGSSCARSGRSARIDRPMTSSHEAFPPTVGAAVSAAVDEERFRIVSGVVRATGDWDLAEDCLQDAIERALARWPIDGIPDNPAAWLAATARRR